MNPALTGDVVNVIFEKYPNPLDALTINIIANNITGHKLQPSLHEVVALRATGPAALNLKVYLKEFGLTAGVRKRFKDPKTVKDAQLKSKLGKVMWDLDFLSPQKNMQHRQVF